MNQDDVNPVEASRRREDARLVARAQQGDREALGRLLQRREGRLFAVALTRLGSYSDAQDAVQEALLEACRKLDSLRRPESVSRWLARILLRKCHHIATARKPVPVEDLPRGETFAFAGSERDDEVFSAVVALPDDQRIVVALRFYLDLSYKEIASVTGDPVGTVKSRMYRATRRLRSTLVGRRTRNEV